MYDLLTGASEFDENPLALAIVPTGMVEQLYTFQEILSWMVHKHLKIQLTSFFYACTNYTESSISSSCDESEASPVMGWEVALFTEQEQSCDQNIVAENIEVGLLFLFLVSGRRDETTV